MTPFELVVRRLRWLARIPLAPQIFDSLLLAWTAFRHPNQLRAMESIEDAAVRIPGVSLTVHRLGGIGFSLGGREMGHLHGNGLLDLFTGRKLARELISTGHAEPHHFFGDSAWVSCWVRSAADVSQAAALLQRVSESSTAAEPTIDLMEAQWSELESEAPERAGPFNNRPGSHA